MSENEDTVVLLNNNNCRIGPSTVLKPLQSECQYVTLTKSNNEKLLTKPLSIGNTTITKPLKSKNKSFIVSIVAVLAGFSFGYDMGIGKHVSQSIKNEFELECYEENIVTNVWFIGSLLGAVFGGILIDTCGRRWTMILSLTFLSLGSLISSFANHYALFLIARIICGYSSTVSAMSHCIYMTEVSVSNKGRCNVIVHQIGAVVGIFLSIIMAVKNNTDYWRYSIGLTVISTTFTCLLIVTFLDESSSFLLLKRIAKIPRVPVKNSWLYVFESVIVMMVMLALREATGRQQVSYYAPRLFALLGVCSNVAKTTSMIALGIVRIFSTILSLVIAEKCGRRTALITSATICMTSISLLSLLATFDKGPELLNFPNEPCTFMKSSNMATSFINKVKYISPTGSPPPFPLLPTPVAISVPANTETWTQVKASCEAQNIITSVGLSSGLQILAVITLLVFESAYALGLGPVPLLTLTEVFPAAVRGKCIGVCVIVMWIMHVLLFESIGNMTRAMTLAGTYLFYSFMCLITVFYIFLLYPETKDKTLNRIAQELRKVSLLTRICSNIKSLPMAHRITWIIKLENKANQTTPI